MGYFINITIENTVIFTPLVYIKTIFFQMDWDVSGYSDHGVNIPFTFNFIPYVERKIISIYVELIQSIHFSNT